LASFPTTHRRELSFPITGTLALPLPGCQTRFRVVPDVAWDRIITAARGNNKLCHSKIACPFGRAWYEGLNAVANAIGYALHRSRSHHAVIRVYNAAGKVIETHNHAGDFKEWQ